MSFVHDDKYNNDFIHEKNLIEPTLESYDGKTMLMMAPEGSFVTTICGVQWSIGTHFYKMCNKYQS